jgi:hypothetical protein
MDNQQGATGAEATPEAAEAWKHTGLDLVIRDVDPKKCGQIMTVLYRHGIKALQLAFVFRQDWTTEDADALLAELSAGPRALIELVVARGGQVLGDEARRQLRILSLKKLMSEISATFSRLEDEGIVNPGLVPPVIATRHPAKTSRERVGELRMRPSEVAAFGAALRDRSAAGRPWPV